MRTGFALLLAVTAAAGAAPAPPHLSIAIENAITRPGRNGKGVLVRPLVLTITGWDGEKPQVEAHSYAGAVTAECVRLQSTRNEWNAAVKYSVTEQPGAPPFAGELTLRLTLDGSIAHGRYEGAFNGIAMSGNAGAGLTFGHQYVERGSGLLLWLPDLRRSVKGIVIWGNGANLDDRHAALRPELQAFAAANNLALIATANMNPFMRQGEGDRILDGIEALAATSGDPELGRAPIYFMGHSNGGWMASAFNAWLPTRVGAFAASHGATAGDLPLSKEALANPGILTAGEIDPKVPPEIIEATFLRMRSQGARVSLVVEQGEEHAPGAGSMAYFLVHLQHVLDHGGPLDEAQAWLADHTTWKKGITKIMPAASFEGDASRMSWLPDQDVATIYRGIATYSNPLKLERAGGHDAAYLRDEPVVLECTRFGDGEWKSIGVYEGATRVGTITRQQPRLTLPSAQKPGAHAAVLVAELPDGGLRTSLPVLWSVWP